MAPAKAPGPTLLPAHVTRFFGGVPAAVTEPRAREIAREEVSSALRQFAEAVDARIKEVRERAERAATPAEYRMPEAWREEELLYVLGFSTVTLDSSKSIGTITALPQRAFRGERLVVDVRRTVNVQNVPVAITGMRVGEASQFVGSGAVPAETFTASAFGVRLGLTPAAPGIVIAVDFSAGAPIPSGEEIRITAALIGRVRREG
jgi:hypothetical protein